MLHAAHLFSTERIECARAEMRDKLTQFDTRASPQHGKLGNLWNQGNKENVTSTDMTGSIAEKGAIIIHHQHKYIR